MISELYCCIVDLEKLLKSENLEHAKMMNGKPTTVDDNLLVLVIHLLAEKVCNDNVTLVEAQHQILGLVLKSKEFVDKLDKKCKRLFESHVQVQVPSLSLGKGW